MTIASGTATTAELVTLHDALLNLQIALRQVKDGSGYGGATPNLGRFTAAQADALVTAVSNAIGAINA